jgi:transposase
LLAEIREQGYQGGYTLDRQFLQDRRPPVKPVATVRFKTRPGEQAQVDFGTFTYERDGKLQRCYAFVMVLSYSRMMYVEFVEQQDLSTFMRCHIHAFEALGISQTILYDNIKVVVTGRDQAGKPSSTQDSLTSPWRLGTARACASHTDRRPRDVWSGPQGTFGSSSGQGPLPA